MSALSRAVALAGPPDPGRSPAEAARAIRRTLLERYGWGAREVSVRVEASGSSAVVRCLIRQAGVLYPFVARVARAHERAEEMEVGGRPRGSRSWRVSIEIAPSVLEPFERDFRLRFLQVLAGRAEAPQPVWGGWRVSRVPGGFFLWPPGRRAPQRVEDEAAAARIFAEAAACGRRILPSEVGPSS